MIKKSYCKINIGLNILSRRADGFSEIQTVMYPVCGIYDLIEMSPAMRFEFTSQGIKVDCPDEENLCVRAYDVMRRLYDLPPVVLHLDKRIPFGAGLGAGSANAVAVIDLCNDLFGLDLPRDEMRAVASMLGSDTAFFVDNVPSVASGRGEILEPIDLDLSGHYIYMVKPDVGVSTAEAYRAVVPHTPILYARDAVKLPIGEWRGAVVNDFERPIFDKIPILAKIKAEMYAGGAVFSSMSGSGSTVYGLFKNRPVLNSSHFCHVEKL